MSVARAATRACRRCTDTDDAVEQLLKLAIIVTSIGIAGSGGDGANSNLRWCCPIHAKHACRELTAVLLRCVVIVMIVASGGMMGVSLVRLPCTSMRACSLARGAP
jgi:hypothetical protein